MRLDKYLQITGLIKRRALAAEACRRGLIKINGILSKATRNVVEGDLIEISLARREMTVKVLKEISGNSLKKSLRPEYFEILKDEIRPADSILDNFWSDIGKNDPKN